MQYGRSFGDAPRTLDLDNGACERKRPLRHGVMSLIATSWAIASLLTFVVAVQQHDSSIGGTPLPPPPPPVATTPFVKDAIATAHRCLSHNTARVEAEQVTSSMRMVVGSEEWEQARAAVSRYVEQRKTQRACLVDLEAVRSGRVMTRQDRRAVVFYEAILVQKWLEAAPVEAGILRRLAAIPSPPAEDRFPFFIPTEPK